MSLLKLLNINPLNDVNILPNFNIENKESKFIKQNSDIKIGFNFAGNSKHLNDHNRSMSFDNFKPLFAIKNTSYYSFHIDEQKKMVQECELDNVIDLSERINNFNDTAVLLKEMDLVITIDSSLAHLAGSLGVKTWVMLSKVPDWRWMLDRSDSPWYPTIRLFRQEELKDWDSVISEIKKALILEF
jgi:hypothetical protein